MTQSKTLDTGSDRTEDRATARKGNTFWHVDRFSALDDLPRKTWSDPRAILRALERVKKVSVFEATEHRALGSTLTFLFKSGYVEDDKTMGYPWTRVRITDAGRAFLQAEGGISMTSPTTNTVTDDVRWKS